MSPANPTHTAKTDFGASVDLNSVGPQNTLVAEHYPETYAPTF